MWLGVHDRPASSVWREVAISSSMPPDRFPQVRDGKRSSGNGRVSSHPYVNDTCIDRKSFRSDLFLSIILVSLIIADSVVGVKTFP